VYASQAGDTRAAFIVVLLCMVASDNLGLLVVVLLVVIVLAVVLVLELPGIALPGDRALW
jgi:hypothetical protein